MTPNYNSNGDATSTSWGWQYTVGFIGESGACPSGQPMTYTCFAQPGIKSGDIIYFRYDSGACTLDVKVNDALSAYVPLASGFDCNAAYHPAVSSTTAAHWGLSVLGGF